SRTASTDLSCAATGWRAAATTFASKGAGRALSSFSRLGRRVSILRGAVLPTTDGTDAGEGAQVEQGRRYQRARQRAGTSDRGPVGVRAADLHLRRRLYHRAPDRHDHTGVPRTGRPVVVARHTRRRRGELDDGRAGRSDHRRPVQPRALPVPVLSWAGGVGGWRRWGQADTRPSARRATACLTDS